MDGQHIAGEILSVDEERVHLHLSDGKAEKIALQRVAVALLRPTPESARALLDRGSAGLLLRGGAFVDGSFKSLDGLRLSMSSVLFGIKWFEVGREAIALVIRRQNGEGKKAPSFPHLAPNRAVNFRRC